jgi:hypothetical protein
MTSPQPQTPTPGGSSGRGQGRPDPTPASSSRLAKAKGIAESPILPLALLTIGGYLAWFGVHYWRSDVKWPTDPIKALLTAKPIPAGGVVGDAKADAVAGLFQAQPAGGVVGSGAGIASLLAGGGNSAIAADALKYQGQGYQFGGRADVPGNWDCSSFLFYVLAHDMGLSVLGGTWGAPGYPPHAHGPTAVQYKMYGTGVATPAAGDIVAWNTHCGIALDANRIIAARTPSEGTGISTISGTSKSINEVPVFRRVKIGG